MKVLLRQEGCRCRSDKGQLPHHDVSQESHSSTIPLPFVASTHLAAASFGAMPSSIQLMILASSSLGIWNFVKNSWALGKLDLKSLLTTWKQWKGSSIMVFFGSLRYFISNLLHIGNGSHVATTIHSLRE